MCNRNRARRVPAQELGQDKGILADSLGIPRINAHFIADSGRNTPLPRGGRSPESLLDEKLLERYPDLDPTPSTSTIAQKLDRQLVTLKKIQPVPYERNNELTIECRGQYAEWWFSESGPPESPHTLLTAMSLHTIYCNEV